MLRNAQYVTKNARRYIKAGTVLGVLAALTAAAQLRPAAAQFMQAMNASMERMDRDMAAAPMNGNVDHDFATMMLPHHQGAIQMAEAELSCGKDPVMRRLPRKSSSTSNRRSTPCSSG
jgi:uncharacterized protein (DUF305 family)